MSDFFKNKVVTVIILLATLVLAGIAIFTAIRLYQLRREAVAPTAPTSKPKAEEPPVACTVLTFNLGTSSPSPSGTGTPTPSGSPTASPSPTATSTASVAPTTSPTAEPSLPASGTSWPTILGIGIGILVVMGSILLAL